MVALLLQPHSLPQPFPERSTDRAHRQYKVQVDPDTVLEEGPEASRSQRLASSLGPWGHSLHDANYFILSKQVGYFTCVTDGMKHTSAMVTLCVDS